MSAPYVVASSRCMQGNSLVPAAIICIARLACMMGRTTWRVASVPESWISRLISR
jgi:hypothetical protein